MRSLANSKEADKMLHNAVFQQGLDSTSSREVQFHFEIITSDPSVYTMDHPKLILSNQKEYSIRT